MSRSGLVGSVENTFYRVGAWFELSDSVREQAALDHVWALTTSDLAVFVRHVEELVARADAAVAQHEREEDGAWGCFIEDRISYNFARLATGHRDPEWVRQHRELVALGELFRFVSLLAGLTLSVRQHGER